MALMQIGEIDPTKSCQMSFSDGTTYNRSPDGEWTDESRMPVGNFTSLYLESIYATKDVIVSEVITLTGEPL